MEPLLLEAQMEGAVLHPSGCEDHDRHDRKTHQRRETICRAFVLINLSAALPDSLHRPPLLPHSALRTFSSTITTTTAPP